MPLSSSESSNSEAVCMRIYIKEATPKLQPLNLIRNFRNTTNINHKTGLFGSMGSSSHLKAQYPNEHSASASSLRPKIFASSVGPTQAHKMNELKKIFKVK
jgi:hypothetical protein